MHVHWHYFQFFNAGVKKMAEQAKYLQADKAKQLRFNTKNYVNMEAARNPLARNKFEEESNKYYYPDENYAEVYQETADFQDSHDLDPPKLPLAAPPKKRQFNRKWLYILTVVGIAIAIIVGATVGTLTNRKTKKPDASTTVDSNNWTTLANIVFSTDTTGSLIGTKTTQRTKTTA